MMAGRRVPPVLLQLMLCAIVLRPDAVVRAQDADSLASSFFSDWFDNITSTVKSKDCPGVCVHALATLICYKVLEDVECPSPTLRCCVEPPNVWNSSMQLVNGTADVQLANGTADGGLSKTGKK